MRNRPFSLEHRRDRHGATLAKAQVDAQNLVSAVERYKLRSGMAACFERAGVPGAVTGMGSLFRLHPARSFVDYRSAAQSKDEAARLERLHRRLIDRGVLLSPTGLGCLSIAVGEAEVLNACLREGDSAG